MQKYLTIIQRPRQAIEFQLIHQSGLAVTQATILTLIFYDQSFAANCPAVLLINEQRIQILFSPAFLLNPRLPPITGTENYAAASDNPTLIFVYELHAQQRPARRRLNFSPASSAIFSAQDSAAFSDSPTLFLVSKMDVVERGVGLRVLFRP